MTSIKYKIHEKGYKGKPLTEEQKNSNNEKSKISDGSQKINHKKNEFLEVTLIKNIKSVQLNIS